MALPDKLVFIVYPGADTKRGFTKETAPKQAILHYLTEEFVIPYGGSSHKPIPERHAKTLIAGQKHWGDNPGQGNGILLELREATAGKAIGGSTEAFDADKASYDELISKGKELGIETLNVKKADLIPAIKAKLA
jgi:hypothetical protein